MGVPAMKQDAALDVTSAVRHFTELGLCDPREIASAMLPTITGPQADSLLHGLLSVKVREVLRALRSATLAPDEDAPLGSRWDGCNSSSFNYETTEHGWTNLLAMTVDDIDEQVANYTDRARATSGMARKFKALASLMRKRSAETVGDLDPVAVQKVMK